MVELLDVYRNALCGTKLASERAGVVRMSGNVAGIYLKSPCRGSVGTA